MSQDIILDSNKVITLDFKQIEQIIKSIRSVIDDSNDCTILLNNEGLFFRSMDASHVALIDMRLDSRIFEKWTIETEFIICFNPYEFYNIIKTLNKKEIVRLEITKEKIIILQKGLKMELKLKEPGSYDCPLPKIPLDICITTTAKTFKEIIKKAGSVSDYLTIEAIDNKIKLSGNGDHGQYEELKTIDPTNENLFDIKNNNDSISTYSLEYTKEFVKSLQKDSLVEFEFSTTKPARITTKLNNYGIIQFYLAPRVEN